MKKKISELLEVDFPLTGLEQFAVVQNGGTKKVNLTQILEQLTKDTTNYGHIGITNDSPFTTQSITPTLVDTWNFDLLVDGHYELSVAIEWNLDNPNNDGIFRFDVNGVQGINLNIEPKDATSRLFLTTFVLTDLNAGANKIEFYANKETANNNILTVYSSRFTAKKIQILS